MGSWEEYKKRLRDGDLHSGFSEEVAEELGDILWYTANVADKFGLDLEEIAKKNLEKVVDRWCRPNGVRPLYDEDLPCNQQLPRRFEYRFLEQQVNDVTKVILVDELRHTDTGDQLTDNSYEDDGYRFHDVMHLAFAAHLSWSPVLRKLLRKQCVIENRKSPLDDAEDGGRGQVIEEAIVAAAYVYATDHGFLEGIDALDWAFLRHIKNMTRHLEVKDRSAWEWNRSSKGRIFGLEGIARKWRRNGCRRPEFRQIGVQGVGTASPFTSFADRTALSPTWVDTIEGVGRGSERTFA